MKSNYSNIETLRAKLKSMSREFTKFAYLGGDGNDQSFEQSFSDIAHSYIQDKAPSLIDYEQGFQVIERSDDDTKAVGVVGFKVNGMQLYAPVFFIRGQVKGHELLYIADSDTFVPLKEQWLNEIFRRKQITIGDPVARQAKGLIEPDLQVLSIPPTKAASYYPSWLAPGVDSFCKMAGLTLKDTAKSCLRAKSELDSLLDFRPYIKLAGLEPVQKFQEYLNTYPLIKAAFFRRYDGIEELLSKESKAMSDIKNSILNDINIFNPNLHKNSGVRVISMSFSMSSSLPAGLSDKEKEKLVRSGVIVQDNRSDDEVSTIIDNTMDTNSAFNPTQSGIYDVLFDPCEVKKAAVIFLRTYEPKEYNLEVKPRVCVYDLSSGRFIFYNPSDVWCSKEYPRSEYVKWMNKQNTGYSISEKDVRRNSVFLVLSPLGTAYGPYSIEKKVDTDKYQLRCCDEYSRAPKYEPESGRRYLCINRAKGSAFTESDMTVRVPAAYGILWLDASAYREYDPDSPQLLDYLRIKPTNVVQFKQAAYKGAEQVKLVVRDGECSINDAPATSAVKGLKTLIQEYGLREKTAEDYMKKAAASKYSAVKFFIKRAEDPGRVKDESISPTFPSIMDKSHDVLGFRGDMAPNGAAISQVRAFDGSAAYKYTPDSPYPAEDAKNVERAIQNGQKEVFDVSMLKQLLTNADTETQVDKLLARLTKGMNAVGRLLFVFYWKGGQFEETYGPQKLPELEGSLRKAFEVLGDIILFLKRNKVNDLNFEGSAPLDLKDHED